MAQTISVLGIDIAKLVFHVVGMDDSGHVVLRKRNARSELLTFIANLPPLRIGSCTSTLRIIPMAHKPGKMPPFHDHVRGQRHDLRRTFLHAAFDGRGVVVPHTLLGVAIRSCCLWPEASYACHATAQALPRTPNHSRV
jgi:hypothetical protein